MMEYINATTISCSIIFIVFIYFIIEVFKLYQAYSVIEKVNANNDCLDNLSQTKLSSIKEAYIQSIHIETEEGAKSNIPASEFFTENSVYKAWKLNIRLLDTASGTLVGLGLLGTFLGLTLGVMDFDSSNTENIQNSIQVLLSGMATAFATSLFGMVFSLVYTSFLDKPFRHRLSKHLHILTDKLDNLYYIDDITLMNLNQRKMMTELNSNIKSFIDIQSHRIVENLLYSNSEGQNVTIANAIREILTENAEQTKALKSFSTDLAIELNSGFDESLSRQMQQKILPLMENVDITTKAIVDHIDKMAEQVSSPATDMIQNIVDELKNSMTVIINEFKTSLSTSATNELENLAAQLGTATQAMADFPKNLANISATLQTTISEVKNAISDISNTSASANSTAMQQMQEQITFATGAISNAITEVKEVMNGITHSSQQQSNQMVNRMADAAEKMSNYLSDTVSALSSSVSDSIKGITDDINRKQENMLLLQQSMMEKIESTMAGMTQNSEVQNNQMVSKLSEAADQMGTFLKTTVSSLSASVQESMKDITDDINNKQIDLIALQEETITQTRKLLETFNNGLERLEKMNESISGTMHMFQQAQGEIIGSTAHLQTITGDMKQATQLFNKSQSEYSDKMERMQSNSLQCIDALTQLLNDSSEMSQEYVEKFEIIKQGIGNIFTQLQAGLSEYSKTVQATTQKYLDQYSSSLTSTTDALSSTIQQQNEVVEMLVESINSRKY